MTIRVLYVYDLCAALGCNFDDVGLGTQQTDNIIPQALTKITPHRLLKMCLGALEHLPALVLPFSLRSNTGVRFSNVCSSPLA
jgi:hypothetical protein